MPTPSPENPSSPGAENHLLRSMLLEFLSGGSAHADARTSLAGMPPTHYGAKLEHLPHTPWQLLEHLRFTLHDLLDFCTNPHYVTPQWPDDYWPAAEAPAGRQAWEAAEKGFLADLTAFEALVENPETDLSAPIPWGQGQTILREALLVIDHNSYHLGQFVMMRKQLGDWKP